MAIWFIGKALDMAQHT